MRIAWLLGAVVALGGCKDARHEQAKGGLAQASEGDLTPEEKGRVLARVGDVTITLEDFERRLNQQSPFARARYNTLERKREFLDSLVRFELLVLEAERKGYGKDPDVVLARKQALVKRLTAEEVRNLVKMSDITDDEVEKYYQEHAAEYQKPAEVRAAHLLLRDEAKAREVLAEVRAQVERDPLKARDIFADFVRKHSEDEQTRPHGGDLQFFGKPGESADDRGPLAPSVAPPVALAAFAIEEVGGLAPEPVRSSKGWHLVQKTGFRRAYKRELEDVRTSIRNKLFRLRKGQAMEDYVARLRDQAKVDIDEAALADVRVEAPSGGLPNLAPPPLPGMLGRPGGVPSLEPEEPADEDEQAAP